MLNRKDIKIMMQFLTISDLCKNVAKTVNEMERKYNCMIFINRDDNAFYMSAMSKDFKEIAKDVKLANVSDYADELAINIRRWFRNH